MPIPRRTLLAGAAALSLPAIRRARAASIIKIGVLSDMSGPYAEASGPGDFLAAQMAAEDFMKTHPDIHVDVIQGDMLLKPDVGASIARGWYDQDGVDAIFDIPQSAVAIAVGEVAKAKDKVVIFTAAGIPDLTGKYCTPNQIQWTYDLWSNANAITRGLVAAGGDSWFFITPDYISGHTMTKDTGAIVEQLGGKVAGQGGLPVPRHHRLLRLYRPGPGQQGQGPVPGQRRRRHRQLHQAGARVRSAAIRHKDRRPGLPGLHQPLRRAGTGGGHRRRHAVLLGHERRHPRLRRPLRAALSQGVSELLPRRQLFRGRRTI